MNKCVESFIGMCLLMGIMIFNGLPKGIESLIIIIIAAGVFFIWEVFGTYFIDKCCLTYYKNGHKDDTQKVLEEYEVESIKKVTISNKLEVYKYRIKLKNNNETLELSQPEVFIKRINTNQMKLRYVLTKTGRDKKEDNIYQLLIPINAFWNLEATE